MTTVRMRITITTTIMAITIIVPVRITKRFSTLSAA